MLTTKINYGVTGGLLQMVRKSQNGDGSRGLEVRIEKKGWKFNGETQLEKKTHEKDRREHK